ncbi:hypothetical protein DVH24_022513 [Malus domestica]|uniref:Uncharacterized protein n=1 Tax=Malus domestica TaxID=3750 RepID=A0A498KJK9_MALDO|nr:hypothetical protein DVH24_022513 [Malus domestica]
MPFYSICNGSFLVEQEHSRKEMGQIQVLDTPTATTASPSGRFSVAEQELESLPHRRKIRALTFDYFCWDTI